MSFIIEHVISCSEPFRHCDSSEQIENRLELRYIRTFVKFKVYITMSNIRCSCKCNRFAEGGFSSMSLWEPQFSQKFNSLSILNRLLIPFIATFKCFEKCRWMSPGTLHWCLLFSPFSCQQRPRILCAGRNDVINDLWSFVLSVHL
jgi:hypothetical protein